MLADAYLVAGEVRPDDERFASATAPSCSSSTTCRTSRPTSRPVTRRSSRAPRAGACWTSRPPVSRASSTECRTPSFSRVSSGGSPGPHPPELPHAPRRRHRRAAAALQPALSTRPRAGVAVLLAAPCGGCAAVRSAGSRTRRPGSSSAPGPPPSSTSLSASPDRAGPGAVHCEGERAGKRSRRSSATTSGARTSPDRYAPGPGLLDWANQPEPFRTWAGAPVVELPLAGRRSDGVVGRSAPARGGRAATARPRLARGVLRARARPHRVEGARRGALGPAREPVERQPAPDRGLRSRAGGARRPGGRLPLPEPRPRPRAAVHAVAGLGGSPRTAPAGRGLPRRPRLHPLARGLEVRRAGLPLLPARRGPRARRGPLRGGRPRLVGAPARGARRRRRVGPPRPRPRRGLRRGGGGRPRAPRRPRGRGAALRIDAAVERIERGLDALRESLRDGDWAGSPNALSPAARRLAGDRRRRGRHRASHARLSS